jgi:hypothetical protein
MPERIRLERRPGWRKPEGAIVVARPSKWGNPFPWQGDWIMWTAVALGYTASEVGRKMAAVALYRSWMTGEPVTLGNFSTGPGSIEYSGGEVVGLDRACQGFAALAASTAKGAPALPAERPDLEPLRGHDLLCWCLTGHPCHADVLLELANR